jgi:parallel beta-helix repeat protein
LVSDYGDGKPPVIDGGLVRELCIWLDRNSYVTVSNIHMQNSTRKGAIRVLRCKNVIVENCTFYVTGHGGVFIENSSTCIIRNNNITTPSGLFNNQTDGIYSQRNDNIIFDNNHIVISNEHPDQHCDGIQSYLDKNIIIRNNYVEQRNAKRSNAQGLYATTMTGLHTYYNNVVYCPNTKSAVVGFRNLKEGKGSLRLYHNTLVGGGSNILFVSENAGIEAKNNIFYSTGKASIVRLETSQVVMDNNLYYHTGKGDVIGFGKGKRSKDVSEMRMDGHENHGISADPMFGVDFKPKANSPAKGKAIMLGPPYDTDKNGRKRTVGSNPDIGAYQIAE